MNSGNPETLTITWGRAHAKRLAQRGKYNAPPGDAQSFIGEAINDREEAISMEMAPESFIYGKFFADNGSSDWMVLQRTSGMNVSGLGYLYSTLLETGEKYGSTVFGKMKTPPVRPETAKQTEVPMSAALRVRNGYGAVVDMLYLLDESFGGAVPSPTNRTTPQHQIQKISADVYREAYGKGISPALGFYSPFPEIVRSPTNDETIVLGEAQKKEMFDSGLIHGRELNFSSHLNVSEKNHKRGLAIMMGDLLENISRGKRLFFDSMNPVSKQNLSEYEKIMMSETVGVLLTRLGKSPPEYMWSTNPVFEPNSYEALVWKQEGDTAVARLFTSVGLHEKKTELSADIEARGDAILNIFSRPWQKSLDVWEGQFSSIINI